MKRILLFFATIAVAIGVSASAATADGCSCGGEVWRMWHQESGYTQGHWDCFYPATLVHIHGC